MRSLALAVLLVASGCAPPPQPEHEMKRGSSSSAPARLRELRSRESALRARYEPLAAPPWIDVSGADPYRIVAWPEQGRARFLGALRGAKALVALDHELALLSRLALPEAPTALCATSPGLAFVASRFSPQITRVALGSDGSARYLGSFESGGSGVMDLACDEDALYALTQQPPRIVTFELDGRERSRFEAMPGGLRLQRRGQYLLESSLFERSLRVLERGARGEPLRERARLHHDGPIWAFTALEHDGALLIALSGVQDEPLVRTRGEFENIDSCLFLYRFAGELQQIWQLNVGEEGLIVPKALALEQSRSGLVLTALSSGSPVLLRAHFDQDLAAAPRLERDAIPPGASDAVIAGGRVVFASPLLDAWVDARPGGVAVHHVERARRPDPLVRLGEALFFTELMAPNNVSRGGHSRFTCETCHFEGGVDGRTHATGRGDVRVVTKPLFGLANNRPHFSRALDADLSAVAHNEFRVAGAGSGADPWFSLAGPRFPWLRELGLDRASFSPVELREALMTFLYAFSHDPNPTAQGRRQFTELEEQGAIAFETHCERCHAARVFSDDPTSRVARPQWEQWVLSRQAPLVWASSDYERTGVLPYVHERGTRVPSLRRLALKPRYFTNGASASLDQLLQSFRHAPGLALHDANDDAGELQALDEATRAALLAFLRLL